jgi:phosphoglycerate dehydrogenase-like enzyme
MKLLIVMQHRFALWNAPAWVGTRLHAEFPSVEVIQRLKYEGIEGELAAAEVAVTWSLRPEQFRLAHSLRWIHSTAAAVHQLMFPELVASDVMVTNARSVHGPVVAEHAMALLFGLAKKLPQAIRFQALGQWSQDQLWERQPRPRELRDATIVLVGMGSIGCEVARLAGAVGMRVLAVREHPELGAGDADAVYGPAQLDEALAQADYVVLATPVTAGTKALINQQRLRSMKPEAYLVNVGRGPLVDEAALVEALANKRIAGAALDVFEREPLPPDSPLWNMDNVLITPHTAAVTEKLWERHYHLLAENLRRYLAREPLLGLVDKTKGY